MIKGLHSCISLFVYHYTYIICILMYIINSFGTEFHIKVEFLGLRVAVYVSLVGTTHLFSEKAMAPHSSTLAWRIPWTEEPGRLQSMGS